MTKDIFSTLFTKVVIIFMGIITSIVTARYLGLEGRGVFYYWTTIAAFAIQFGNLGLQSGNIFLYTQKKISISDLNNNSIWIVICTSFFSMIILTLYFFLTYPLALKENLIIFIATLLMIPTGIYYMISSNLFVAMKEFKTFNRFELLHRFIPASTIILVAWYFSSPEKILLSLSIVYLLISLFLFLYLEKTLKIKPFKKDIFYLGFGYAFRAYLATLFGFFTLKVSILFLELYLPNFKISQFSISAQIIDFFIILPATVALVIKPTLMQAVNPYMIMFKQLKIFILIFFLMIFFLFFFGKALIIFLYGVDFANAYDLLIVSVPGIFSISCVTILSQYLASKKMPIQYVLIWCTGLIFEISMFAFIGSDITLNSAMKIFSLSHILVLFMVFYLVLHFKKKYRE